MSPIDSRLPRLVASLSECPEGDHSVFVNVCSRLLRVYLFDR